MHPRFKEFVERLSEYPHHHKQRMAFSGALMITALLVGARFYYFPVTDVSGGSSATIAGVAESFNRLKGDLTEQSQKMWEKTETMQGGQGQNTGSLGVPPELTVGGDAANQGAPAGWVPDPNGGAFYVEYPTGVDTTSQSVATTTVY